MEKRMCRRCSKEFEGEAWESFCEDCVASIAGSQTCVGCNKEYSLMFYYAQTFARDDGSIVTKCDGKMVECAGCGTQQLNNNLEYVET